MRKTESARVRRHRKQQLHRKRGKSTSYDRRWMERQYAGYMQHEGGNDGVSAEQRRFARVWLQGVLDEFAKPPRRMSLSAVARMSKVHRNNITDWLNLKAFPQAKTLKRFCDNLGLDYSVPSGILGWSNAEDPAHSVSALELKIQRARHILKSKSLTDEQRSRYRSMLAGYERAYEGMLDQLIEEFERDLQGADGDHPNE